MGESISDPLAALEQARAHFASATDFTIGIEEEFQILDPDTLELTQRYPELRAMADASPLAGGVAGELIKSEIEIKTGRCETFAEAAAQIRERRRLLFGLADELGVGLGANGTHPFSPLAGPGDHRHAALPDRRGPAQVRRVAQQHVRHPRPRRRSATPTARWRSATRSARSCPS